MTSLRHWLWLIKLGLMIFSLVSAASGQEVWESGDIGGVGQGGSAEYLEAEGAFAIRGSGGDIWGSADGFHYVYRELVGDGQIVARVTGVQNTSSWAKAGVMMRESLAAGAKHASMVVTPGSGVSLQYRETTGGSSGYSSTGGKTAPHWVRLIRRGNVFYGYYSADGEHWVLQQQRTIGMGEQIYVGLAVTANNNTALCAATFEQVSLEDIHAAVGALTLGGKAWHYADIGQVGWAGATDYQGGALVMKGSGSDIWNTADNFHFTYVELVGDGQIVARVAGVENTDNWAKAGVMMRESLEGNAREASMVVSPGAGVSWQCRETTGGSTANAQTGGKAAPLWVKLVRRGNVFYGYYSADGEHWVLQQQRQINMAEHIYMGLAVTSHNNAKLCEAVVDQVSLSDQYASVGDIEQACEIWHYADIGAVKWAGLTVYQDGLFTLKGSGNDIWDGADSFHYTYMALAGDRQIIARVTGVENTHNWAKAGVMMRESLANDAKYADMVVSPGSGASFQYRTVTGGNSSLTTVSKSAPCWVKLVRTGRLFLGYYSDDGASWTLLNACLMDMEPVIYVGLAVTAHNNDALCAATFEQVEVLAGNGLPDWWQTRYFGQTGLNAQALAPAGNGLTILQAYQSGCDPHDYYSQPGGRIVPQLTIVSGNHQSGQPGQFLSQPLTVRVTDSVTGLPLVNAPVAFDVTQGGGKVTVQPSLAVTQYDSLTVRTNANGEAQAWHWCGTGEGLVQAGAADVQGVGFTVLPEQTDEAVHWDLNEGNGAQFENALGYKGILSDNYNWTGGYNGKGGLSFAVDSHGAEITSPAGKTLNYGGGSFSISLWFKMTHTGRLLSKGHFGWTNGYFISVGHVHYGSVAFGVGAGGERSQATLVATKEEFNDGRWHHAVAVHDRENQREYIYVDGVRRGLDKDVGTGGTLTLDGLDISGLNMLNASAAERLTFGNHLGVNERYTGELDEVALYNHALTAAEARQLYDADSDGNGLPDWWEMKYFGQTGVNPDADDDGDGLSNGEEYLLGSKPNDYYSQGNDVILPELTLLSGQGQTGRPGQFLDGALVFKVKDRETGLPLVNAPVTVKVLSANGEVGNNNLAISPVYRELTLRTGLDGTVSVWAKAGQSHLLVGAQTGGADEVQVPAKVYPFAVLEQWNGLDGTAISDLVNHPHFSDPPDATMPIASLTATAEYNADKYGIRIRGYVLPPQDGYYRFWVAGDDNVELWLSTSDSPFERKRVAWTTGPAGWQAFDGHPAQGSYPVKLQAGQRYYFEMLFKENGGKDYYAVAWTRPDGQREVIGGAALAGYEGDPDDVDGDGLPDSWERAHGLNAGLRHGAHGAHGDPDGDGLTNLQECQLGLSPIVDNRKGVGLGSAAGTLPGVVLVEQWNGIEGNNVADLTGHARYQEAPDERRLITDLEMPLNRADHYGIRIRGYVLPDTTGLYQFWLASDDQAEFWLSSDEQPENKSKRLWGVNSFRNFNNSGHLAVLVAGRAYYFELYHKEHERGDFVSVAWKRYEEPQLRLLGGKHIAYYESGLPDWWQRQYFGHAGVDPNGDGDGDGVSNLEEYRLGSDPSDYYSQGATAIVPQLLILGGNNQTGAPDQFLAEPLKVKVTDSLTGLPLVNAPVTFSVTQGGGKLALQPSPAVAQYDTLTVRTDGSGCAQVDYLAAADHGMVSASTGGGQQADFIVNASVLEPMVTMGAYHAGALKSDGSVWMWGNNEEGQLGQAAGAPHAVPQPLSLPSSVRQLSGGGYHTLALMSDGRVMSFGRNVEKQLGRSGNSLPAYVAGLNNVVAVAAGGYHNLALRGDGTVWAWGANWSGQLGKGIIGANNAAPGQVVGLNNVIAIAAGSHASYALKADGTVWGWGDNGAGQLGDGSYQGQSQPVQVSGINNVKAIAAGWEHAAAVKQDGTAWAWGASWSGQIGSNIFFWNTIGTPQQMDGIASAVAVAAGSNHTLIVMADGSMRSCGSNFSGQLGNGQAWVNSLVMGTGTTLLGNNARQAAAGAYATLVLRTDGCVSGFGYLEYGQLGDGIRQGRNRPQPMHNVTNALGAAGGVFHSAVLRHDGSVSWSGIYETQNTYVGGGGGMDDQHYQAEFSANAYVQIASGKNHTLALKADGSVWGWGVDYNGQLGGIGTTMEPKQLPGLSGVAHVAAAGNDSLAVTADGQVYVWGNGSGNTPTLVNGLNGVVRGAAGDNFMLALKADGTVWAWGDNSNGKLLGSGNGMVTAPTQVSGLSKIVAVSAGNNFALALREDGTVWSWGLNNSGQLASGNTATRGTAAPIGGLEKVVMISAGGQHGLALLHDGTVRAWGDNSIGQLGDGTFERRALPVSVAGLEQVVSISAGQQHSLALKKNGTAWAWGNNGNEQLGVSVRTEHRSAIRLVPSADDLDEDGLPDAWEQQHFGSLKHDGAADSDGDGLTDMQEYLLGTNPNQASSDGDLLADGADPQPLAAQAYAVPDYQLTIVSGNNQSGAPNEFTNEAFVVQLSNSGALLRNQPIAFAAEDLQLATARDGGGLGNFIISHADAQGRAGGVYCKLPETANASRTVTVSALGCNVTLTVSTINMGNGDNGLSDWWQQQYFGHLGVNPNEMDAENGVTYLQDYLEGRIPHAGVVPDTGNVVKLKVFTRLR